MMGLIYIADGSDFHIVDRSDIYSWKLRFASSDSACFASASASAFVPNEHRLDLIAPAVVFGTH
jgi:hypothetical protein